MEVRRAAALAALALVAPALLFPGLLDAAPSASTAASPIAAADTAGSHGAQATTPAPAGAPAEPRVYLTANAPYGQPGAADRLSVACGDSSMLDTLYMVFDPGRDAEHFNGLSATLYFWPAGRDTLGPHWNFGAGTDFKRLKVQFAPDGVPGFEVAWVAAGVSGAGYRSTKAAGRLSLLAASPAGEGPPVKAGTLYGLARILVPRPLKRSKECSRAMCIEWAETSLAFKLGELVQANRGQRFVTWNSSDGKACGPMREVGAPQPWKPGSGAKRP